MKPMRFKTRQFRRLLGLFAGGALLVSCASAPNKHESLIIPEQFDVYAKDHTVANESFPQGTKKILPTINAFQGVPGGYIACYSHTKEGSAYGVSRDIFVVGQIRMAGRYRGGIFQPQGYENKDISAEPPFKDLCKTAFPVCQRQCWAGGDTEKWFGDP